jgi:hypothetical protein
MYPITIIDNFFRDPDAVVDLAKSLEYHQNDGAWPGSRTKLLSTINQETELLFHYFGSRVHSLFYETPPDFWEIDVRFQKIDPYHDEKYNKKNRGWIHRDDHANFGGIIYLTKDPEKDTGTSIYKPKNEFTCQFENCLSAKEDLYLGENRFSDDEYENCFDRLNDQYIETITIENVYNRLVLFDGNTYHGVKTFGKSQRLTLSFFGISIGGKQFPLHR